MMKTHIKYFKNELQINRLGNYFNTLKPHLKYSNGIYRRLIDEKHKAIGGSKIGGRPDLPIGMSWPTKKISDSKYNSFSNSANVDYCSAQIQPLKFIAQINLDELIYDIDDILPKSGILYFFLEGNCNLIGDCYTDKDVLKVIYWNGDFKDLRRSDFPKELKLEFQNKCYCPDFMLDNSYPNFTDDIYDVFDDYEKDVFFEELICNTSDERMLGYAEIKHYHMESKCNFIDSKYTLDNLTNSKLNYQDIKSIKDNWIMLLQLNLDYETNLNNIQDEYLFIYIPKNDLSKLEFDNCRCFFDYY